MKRSLSFLTGLLFLSAGLSLMSCAGAGDDFSAPGSATPTATPSGSGTPAPVSFANTVYPYLSSSCAIASACHQSGGSAPTGVVGMGGAGSSAATAFSSIMGTQLVVVQSATAATAETSMLLCKPLSAGSTCSASDPGGAIHNGGTQFQSQTDSNYLNVLNWIEQGAQNN